MNLDELIAGLPVDRRVPAFPCQVDDVVEDSRDVTPGALFVARSGGADDGRRYIEAAIAAGAVAVLTDRRGEIPPGGAVHLVTDDVPRIGAVLAERVHGEPSARLRLVGVTGTNGKTTVTWLLHQILTAAGERCGLLGTVAVDDGSGALVPARLTTPPAFETSRLLRRMTDHGCTACVMEASSHALVQERTAGLTLAGAVFTNLSGDHLDFHGTPAAYAAAKARLFAQLPEDAWAVVNVDDPAAGTMLAACRGRVIGTSLGGGAAPAACRAQVGALSITGTAARFTGPFGRIDVDLPLVGRHNVANALQAAAAAAALGLDAEAIRAALAGCTAPPGRLEPVSETDDGFTVLVDYAHTDDALDNVLRALRPTLPPHGRLLVVFGCGGDRDRTKRPRMGAAAARWADAVYITSDNPRSEHPGRIIEEAAAGVPGDRAGAVQCIVDRADAIDTAVNAARPGDVVLVAGKGHEREQIIGTIARPFDDRDVARAALARRRASAAGISAS